MISGVQSHLSIGKMFPISGLGGVGGVKILLISVLMISGVQSHLSIGKMFPISGLGGGEGGNSISFFLSWGCVRDSGGVDLQTKL